MMMDAVFGEANRLAILNWQKTTVKNNPKHVSQTIEYARVSEDIKCNRPLLF
jgi:adenine-specific DNA-methyltransferase